MHRSESGMILEQFLLSLAALMLLAPTINLILSLQLKLAAFDESVQDEIAIAQLRRILNAAEDFHTGHAQLSFTYHEETCSLYCINDHLILTPGTQIFLSEIPSVSFRQAGHEITVVWTRNGHEEERIIAWE